MSGGWSYGRSQFNRAVQASRQPGSSFKPFVYLAAMDAGLTPASVVQDAPFSYDPGLRPAGLDAQELRRRLSRPDDPAARARAVAQPDDGARRPADRHEEGGRRRQGIRRRRQYGPLSADGAGRRRHHLAAHDHGLRHAGQRRARDHAVAGRSRAGPQRQDRLSPRAAHLQGLRRAAARPSSRRRPRSSIRASPSTIPPRSTRSCTCCRA